MKVTLLSHDLSENCLGRAYLLGELLERNHETEIVGPILGEDIWEPIQDRREYKGVKTNGRFYNFGRKIPKIREQITGDVIYAVKPRATSYGIGLIEKIAGDRPLILDIDDWETGFEHGKHSRIYNYITGIPKLLNLNTFYYTRGMEALSGVADARTVSNTFLQDNFGGELIPHVRDTDVFDPGRFNKQTVRERFDLPEEKTIVMFSGTPRPHKGVEDLVRAIESLDRDDVVGVIVGAHDSDYTRKLADIAGDSVIIRGQQPFDEIPAWLAAADIICIPQRDNSSTSGQVPAKIFDAMSMGKPIITTNTSDLPEVIGECGLVIEPNKPDEIANNIVYLIDNDRMRDSLGRCARSRAIKHYSYDSAAPPLEKVLKQALTSEKT